MLAWTQIIKPNFNFNDTKITWYDWKFCNERLFSENSRLLKLSQELKLNKNLYTNLYKDFFTENSINEMKSYPKVFGVKL